MLLLKNISSRQAKNGFEALQILAEGEKYDVIVMDYHMPYMDGLETIRQIRTSFYQEGEEQPVILLHSSSDDAKIIDACEELDIRHRMVKPIKMQDIYNVLSRLNEKGTDIDETPETDQAPVGNFTVLVAEDNPVNMMLIRSIVNKIAPDSSLIEVSNGLEAVEYCQTNTPDIVLMDIQMPEMNGYEATKAIRLLNKEQNLPIVAITAGNVKGEKEKCLEAGMDDFVVKPIREENIIAVFDKWLDRS
jgi:CheY-like chemotaxis protein